MKRSRKGIDERMDARERRVTATARASYLADVEMRAEGDETAPVISGYAAVFDSESELIGSGSWGFREVIRPGAFNKTVREADVVALFNHDPSQVLGRNTNKTLTLDIDERGLRYRVEIDPENGQAMDTWRMIKRGDVHQSSFGFRPVEQRWTEHDDEPDLRELLEVELFDVSPVTYPAYAMTSVDARSISEAGGRTMREEGETEKPNEEKRKGDEEQSDAPAEGHAEEPAPGHSVREARQRLAELNLKTGGA